MALSDKMLGQFGRLEPAEPKLITREIPIGDNMVTTQTSIDGGMTWTDVGKPYPRFKPDKETGERIFGEGASRLSEPEREIASKVLSLLNAGSTPMEVMDWVSSLAMPHKMMRKIAPMLSRLIEQTTGKNIMSPAEGRFEGSPHSEGPFWRQFNKGGIVSLKHLTRPLKV